MLYFSFTTLPASHYTDHSYLLFIISKDSFNYYVYYQQQMVPDDTKRQDAQKKKYIMAILF